MEVFRANGVEGTSGVFIQELYRGVECEARVGPLATLIV